MAQAHIESGDQDQCVHRHGSQSCASSIRASRNIVSYSTCAIEGHREHSRWPSMRLGEGNDGTHQALSLKAGPRGPKQFRETRRNGAGFADLFRDRLVGRTLSSELRNAGSNPAPGTEVERARLVRLEAADTAPRRCTDTCALWGALLDNSSLCESRGGACCSLRASTALRARGDILGSSSRAQHRARSLGSGFVLGRRPAL
jgi:hypothetical protein